MNACYTYKQLKHTGWIMIKNRLSTGKISNRTWWGKKPNCMYSTKKLEIVLGGTRYRMPIRINYFIIAYLDSIGCILEGSQVLWPFRRFTSIYLHSYGPSHYAIKSDNHHIVDVSIYISFNLLVACMSRCQRSTMWMDIEYWLAIISISIISSFVELKFVRSLVVPTE